MAFYNGTMGGGMGAGAATPSAFTSPGLDPTVLALLMRMQGMGGMGQPGQQAMPGGPQIPMPPQAAAGGLHAPPMAAPGPQQGQGLGQMLGGMDMSKLVGLFSGGGGGGGNAQSTLNSLLQGQSGNNLMQQWGVSPGAGNPYFSSGQ